MPQWTFADPATGALTGQQYAGPERGLASNTPAGLVAVPGCWDHRLHQWDTEAARVMPRSPAPPTVDELAAAARAERARLLSATDWTQLADVPDETSMAWRPYRQALRDITEQPGYPATITWPDVPA